MKNPALYYWYMQIISTSSRRRENVGTIVRSVPTNNLIVRSCQLLNAFDSSD